MMTIERFNSEAMCGYTQISTFYEDFSIAEHYGLDAIKDTYKNAFKNWKSDCKMVTELCMVLNWKSWRWAEKNDEFCQFYIDKFYELQDWCYDNLKDDDLAYFIRTTD